jgi:hypothetical protein
MRLGQITSVPNPGPASNGSVPPPGSPAWNVDPAEQFARAALHATDPGEAIKYALLAIWTELHAARDDAPPAAGVIRRAALWPGVAASPTR